MGKNQTKSEERRTEAQTGKEKVKSEEKTQEKKTEKKIVKPYDGKYRVTFLTNQMFKGLYRKEGTSMEVPAHVARAYGKRATLKFEKTK